MSSRALRKAQKARERLELEQNAASREEHDSNDESSATTGAKPSIFAMLSPQEDDGTADVEDDAPDSQSTAENEVQTESAVNAPQNDSPATKRRKAKKRKAKTSLPSGHAALRQVDTKYDDIDAALRSLSISRAGHNESRTVPVVDDEIMEACQLLSVDNSHLQVSNEMRRLFGRAALHAEREDREQSSVRRQGPNGDSLSLADAVAGKFSVGGAGLTPMLLRRNIFVQGQQDWPRATGSGLGMEIVEKRAGGVIEFRFSHNRMYEDAQREFQACVSSMDPMRMVNLLRHNPYHISTLLQVSEIAKQERDHATSGELLERALFSFGRAVHSSFAGCLWRGKARLDFRRPENREFWLAAWRYIGNIGMRATWRTAFEWAKLLLSLDPEDDPYCVRLVIDQLALRSHQAQTFLDLSSSTFFTKRWHDQPNIAYSRSLAAKMVAKDAPAESKAELLLMDAIRNYPWVAARLFTELEMDKTPACIWGKEPETERDRLYTELYATLAQDLWKLPHALPFLSTTASHVTSTSLVSRCASGPITMNEGRFVILTDKPALVGLLPRAITTKLESASDPLPPVDSISSYETRSTRTFQHVAADIPVDALIRDDPGAFIREIHELQSYFELLVPGLARLRDASADEPDVEQGLTDSDIDELIAQSTLPTSEIRACLARLLSLRDALVRQPDRTVVSTEGDEVAIMDDGMVRAVFRDDESDVSSWGDEYFADLSRSADRG